MLGLEVGGRVAEQQLALMHESDAMAALGFVEIGGGGENGHAFGDEFVENAPEVAARNRIDARGGLVEQDHLGAMNERADQAEFLLHAAGEFAGHAGAELAHAGGLKQLRGARGALGLADAEQIGVKADVFVDGEIFIEAEALRHVTERVFGAFGIADHVAAGDGCLARSRAA